MESILHDSSLEVIEAMAAPAGSQGTRVLTLRRGGVVLRAKWRTFESASLFSDPRKELGAYAVQRLFLPPDEYVVPPTAGHCFDLERYRARVDRTAQASFSKTSCVFGVLSYWLPNAHDVEEAEDLNMLHDESLYDEALFRSDPVYRRSIANLNLSAYLVSHADAHDGQFLLVNDSGSTRAYTVDNSMAFRSIQNPMVLFREDWSTLRVPTLPRASCQRLREIDERALESLQTIEEYEFEEGRLAWRTPQEAVVRPDAGLRWVGRVLEVGLTQDEIDGVASRLNALTEQVLDRNPSACN